MCDTMFYYNARMVFLIPFPIPSNESEKYQFLPSDTKIIKKKTVYGQGLKMFKNLTVFKLRFDCSVFFLFFLFFDLIDFD